MGWTLFLHKSVVNLAVDAKTEISNCFLIYMQRIHLFDFAIIHDEDSFGKSFDTITNGTWSKTVSS